MKEYIVNEKIKVIEDQEDNYIELYYKDVLLYKSSKETTSIRLSLIKILKDSIVISTDAYTTVKEIQETLGLQEYGIAQIGVAMSKAGFKSTVTWLNNKPTRVYKGVQCKKLY